MHKILLIEDNAGDILLIKEAFEEIKATVDLKIIKDGELASNFILEMNRTGLTAQLPDLIILDINLPKINGLELLKLFKSSKMFKEIPLVILTSSSTANDIHKAYENNANAFITKPSELRNIYNLISGIYNFWLNKS